MRAYISVLRVRFLNGLQYRAAALGGLATQFFWGIMLVFLFQALYSGGNNQQAMSFQQLVTYIWLQQAFLSLLMLYNWDYELFDMITTGNISYELCRPASLYGMWYTKLLSIRLASAALRFSPILLIAFLLPQPYKLGLPASSAALLLFLVTMTLGFILLVAISMLIYISVFVTMSPVGSMALIGIIGEFFSGMTIPIPFMPLWLQKVCYFLPFRWTVDLPLRIYSGNIGTGEAFISIAVQLVWIVLLTTLGSCLLKRILNRIVIQGG